MRTIGRWTKAGIALLLFALPGAQALAAPRSANDPYFDEQWYLRHIGVPTAWNDSLGFEGIIVAVIDSGVDTGHPDLKDNIWRNDGEVPGDGIDNDRNGYIDDVRGWDFVGEDNDPRPEVTASDNAVGMHHGTINAGIIAARGDNGIGISGVTWQTTIMPIRALNSNGSGDPYEVVRAVEYAVHNGAKIINMSFTGSTENETLRIALRQAYDRGVFVVAAAGNAPEGGVPDDLDRDPLYPICLDSGSSENFIYGVAAVDQNDAKATFSNFGAGCVDGSAPGTRFIGTQVVDPERPSFGEPYGGYFNGTSLAAPVISGVAALMRAMNPKLTPKQITNMLTESSFDISALNPGYFGKIGRGRVDAAKAIALTKDTLHAAPVAVPTTQSLLSPGTGGTLLVTAPGPGRAPDVRLFTTDGLFVRGFLAYPEGFKGGVTLAVAKFDGNSRQTIVTGAGAGGSPQIRIFNVNTQAIGGFLAYDPAFTGGIDVAVGNIEGDVSDEIITGAGPGGGPHVRSFDGRGNALGGFFAFDKTFRGGVDVAAGDVDGDDKAEIIAASGKGRVTTVRIFRKDGTLLAEAKPFGETDTFGASVEAVDIDGDGTVEILVRTLAKGGEVRFVDGDGKPIVAKPTAPYLVGSGKDAQPVVTSFARNGTANGFYAYEPKFTGGVRAGIVQME